MIPYGGNPVYPPNYDPDNQGLPENYVTAVEFMFNKTVLAQVSHMFLN